MTQSMRLAGIAVIIVAVWLLSGQFVNSEKKQDEPQEKASPLMSVSVMISNAQQIRQQLMLQGQLLANENLTMRAQTAGTVERLLVEEGDVVAQGQLLLQIDERDRRARLASIEAQIAHKKLNLKAMRRLKGNNLQSENNVALAKAELMQVQAEKSALLQDLSYTRVEAPFPGVVNVRQIAQGSYVDMGDSMLELVDISRLAAETHVSQQLIGKIHMGQSVSLQLLDGRSVEAKVSFISHQANVDTRSFRVEAEFDNSELHIKAGGSLEIKVYGDTLQGHEIPLSLLTLNEQGGLGVKAVSDQGEVVFYPVKRIRMSEKGVWVSGLPAVVNLIQQGQNFVVAGEKVRILQPEEPS